MSLPVVRVVRRAVGFVGITLFAVLLGFSLLTHIAQLTGHQLFIVGGGSMEPVIPVGSLVVVSPTDANTVAVGAVITVRADNGVVFTHRVVRVVDLADGRYYATKGDANQTADGGLVPARAIVGTADTFVPVAGYLQEYLSRTAGFVVVLGILGGLFLVYVLLQMIEPSRDPSQMTTRDPVSP
jgi:signal peptidase I